MSKTIEIQIKRQLTPEGESFWDEFSIPYRPNMNLIAVLQEIAASPTTKQGKASTPVSYDANCLEEICGACTMLVNGKSRQACTALIDQLEQPIKLEPMKKFPVIRDLQVNRQRLFNDLIRVKAWIPIDGSYDLGVGPRMSQKDQEAAYPFSHCISCGNCLEVCPQYNDDTGFVGAAVIGQVRLFNSHPTGKMNAHERLTALTGPGGIHECGFVQNCVKACPKEIPLTQAISQVGRDVVVDSVLNFLRG
jgi:succinate dehydrogenase / fumarate reductase iron-sulfur subunit